MHTPSLVSDSSDDTSMPSQLAGDEDGFYEWMSCARVARGKNPPQDVLSQFDDLYRLEALPEALQGTAPDHPYKKAVDFQQTVRKWAMTLPSTAEDKYDIMYHMPVLALSYSRTQQTANNKTKKHGQLRRGVDDILEIAFTQHGSLCDFNKEESYRLVQLDSNPDAQSDTMITLPFPDKEDALQALRFSYTDPSLLMQLYWSTKGAKDDFSIILFPGEFKKDDRVHNKNQLIMAFATAQSQRKALELPDSIIMGATSARGHVQIYSSYWDEMDKSILRFYEHKEQFDLTDPTKIVHLYIFCAKLRNSFQEKFIQQLQEFIPPDEAKIKGLMWRSTDKMKKTCQKRKADEAWGDDSDIGGGSGHRGGGEWDMQLNAWKHEAIEGAKEASVISGSGKSLTKSRLKRLATKGITCVL